MEFLLIAVWLVVVFFWPSYKTTLNHYEKPAMVLATAIIVAALILVI